MFDPFNPPLKFTPQQQKIQWANVSGAALALSVAQAAHQARHPLLVITPDSSWATKLERELKIFGSHYGYPILQFPDKETLPYDLFSPHQDIISDRLLTLYQLPHLEKGIVIVPIATLMQRLCPPEYLQAHCFNLKINDTLNLETMQQQLTQGGYYCVSQVQEHGEFAFRGSILDIFPMGTEKPIRIDLFDNTIDSLRYFDAVSQRSEAKIDHITILPAKEFPLTDEGIKQFQDQWQALFAAPGKTYSIYNDITNKTPPAGIEYYLPLFFTRVVSLLDYLPSTTTIAFIENIYQSGETFFNTVNNRYDQYAHDIERPVLAPLKLFFALNELFEKLKQYPQIQITSQAHSNALYNANCEPLPDLSIQSHQDNPLANLIAYIANSNERVLLCAESKGRREAIIDLLAPYHIHPQICDDYLYFLHNTEIQLAITIAPLDKGALLPNENLAIISEAQLYGERVMQRRRRQKTTVTDPQAETGFHSLTEITLGAPIVHIEYGVGRYRGLTYLNVGEKNNERLTEFLTIEYANQDKLYIPIASLQLITQYSGSDPEHAPLNKLGTDHWDKAKRKAFEKARDVAAELLEIYAHREAKIGIASMPPGDQYIAFKNQFPFEETPDQAKAIEDVLRDMQRSQPMDRLVCGDVGFGKTEVALRAAFLAIENNKQVAVLVPTTLLAQQHFDTFSNRFADWPIKVELLSRFRTAKEEKKVIEQVKSGTVDILIGTHKIIQNTIHFNNLGLLIIDEEHRFGVHQKEKFKCFRTQVDILTLTATPIPRTLNMAMASIRDLSIIATPPQKRLSIKTFIKEHNPSLIKEAILRELMRGGQVYYLHNSIETIAKITQDLQTLVPEARVDFAHGQMPERDLERIMSNFYHQRFNILVCTTIIETGIDIPTANTIIIHRADKFGLAQLHQLRGRVGRSHHQAYAYCLTPPLKTLNKDAMKRLQALESLEELGSGFTLATHDLEIRGAGELLGDEQSGNIQTIGFTLYMELLDRAVKSLQAGEKPSTITAFHSGLELNLNLPALIPEAYLPDVQARLVLYKRISNAKTDQALSDLKSEMIDRFGLLPAAIHNLLQITSLKLVAQPIGIKKIDANAQGGRIIFNEHPNVNIAKILDLVSKHPAQYQLHHSKEAQQLRFIQNMDKIEDRFEIIDTLLKNIRI